jgi:dolichol kinase
VNTFQKSKKTYSIIFLVKEWSLHLFDAIFGCVWLRKIYHLIAGGLLAVAIVLLDANWFSVLCVVWIILFRAMSKRVSTAVIGLLLLSVLSGSRFTTLGAAVIFVVGDGMAGLVGSAFGVTKWPWSDRKTILGSLSFFMGASLAMFGVLSILVQSSPGNLISLAMLPSLIGGLVEAMSFALVRDIRDSKPDDNLLVVLSSGATLHWLTKFLQIERIF